MNLIHFNKENLALVIVSPDESELKKGIKEELHLDELTTKKKLELAIEKIGLDRHSDHYVPRLVRGIQFRYRL